MPLRDKKYIVGVTRDASFGSGAHVRSRRGSLMEVLKDVAFRVLPITLESAAEMIEEIKGYSL